MDFSDDFNRHSEKLRARRRQDDFDNLQHTLSGVETGHQARHGLSKDGRGSALDGRRKSVSERLRETLEWLLLNDPRYFRLHTQTIAALRKTEQFAQTTLQRILAALAEERDALEDLLSRAAALPNGQKVFRDKYGNLRNEQGDMIADAIAGSINWRGNEPSFETFIEQRNRVQALESAERELRGIETRLGGVRGEMTDNDEPPSSQRLDSLGVEIEELENRIREIETDALNFTNARVADELRPDAQTAKSTGSRELAEIPAIEIKGKP